MATIFTPAYPGQPPSGAAAGVLSNIKLTSNAASGLVKLGGPKRKNSRKSRKNSRKTRKTTRKNRRRSTRRRR
jgi:hypothetical protein